jgi:hypothetical protein
MFRSIKLLVCLMLFEVQKFNLRSTQLHLPFVNFIFRFLFLLVLYGDRIREKHKPNGSPLDNRQNSHEEIRWWSSAVATKRAKFEVGKSFCFQLRRVFDSSII